MKNGKRRKPTKAGANRGHTDRQRAGSPVQSHAPTSAPGRLKTWHVVVGLLVGLIAVLEIYGAAIKAPFMFDDKYLAFALPSYQELPLSAWLIGVRPSLMITYWANYQLSGMDAYSYHVLNVLLHYLNAVLVFLIIRKLLEWMETEKWHRELIAVFAGGIFLLHPLQTEAVAYVASRSENLSVFFMYAALVVYFYRRSKTISFLDAFLILLLFGGAVTSKEHTAVLPFVLVLTDYFFNPGFSVTGIKRNWRLYAPIVVAGSAGFAFILSKLAESDTAGFRVEGLPWYIYFVTQCKVIWFYARMFLFPFGQNVDHDYPMIESVTDPFGLAGMAALLALCVALWIYRRRFPMVAYGTYVYLLLLAPTSSIVPISDAFVERRIYLPMIGLLFIAAGLLRRWRTDSRTLAATLGVLLLATGILGYQRTQVWASPLTLWEDSVSKSPRNWRASFQLAYAYYDEQRCSEAIDQYAVTAELDEPDYRLLVDWALACDCGGRPADALAKLEQAAALEETAHVYSLIGMMHAKQGHASEASAALDTAEKMDPDFGVTYFYRANLFTAAGDHAKAAEQYRRAIELEPGLEAAHRGLRRSLQRLGQAR